AAAIVLRGMAKDGEFALKNNAHGDHEKTVKNVVESAVKEISRRLEEMAKAAEAAATAAGDGGETAVGNVIKASDNAAKGGDAKSVNGIANGIKGIVDAAEKAGEEGKLSVVAVAGDGTNADAGKLFANKKDNDKGGGDAKDAGKAAAAVSAVSGEQILKAIVEAAKGDGKAVEDVKDAKNPIEAAIGSSDENKDAGAFADNGMKKDDQIAAAIVLRGMAKDGEFALKNAAHGDHEKTVKNVVESAVKEISGWLEEMAKAAKDAATAATGGGETAVGKVIKASDNAAKGGDEKSVNGIANGIKGIVDAAEKAGEEGKLSVVAAAGGADNADAGKLFANKNNDGGDDKDAGKAAAAVSAVSGEQILKAIVEAAGKGDGKAVAAVEDAKNPIEAAIGSSDEKAAGAFTENGMKKDDQIAAAIVLRGMAKDGEFALKEDDHANHEKTVKNVVESAVKEISRWLEEMAKAAKDAATAATGGGETAVGKVIKASDNAAKGGDEKSVNGIANGIKGIVDAAEKAGEEGKLSVVAAAGDGTNADAGKLFANKNNDGGDDKDAGKAAAAVSAVSGEQILKAIVEAAGKGDGKAVAAVEDAKNPIEAAIGSSDEKAAGAFTENGMKKDDQIAAAIVLRGMAKDGEFALKEDDHANHEKTVKNVVESAVKEISRWLEEMAKAAKDAATAAGDGGETAVGKVIKAEAGKAAAKGGDAKSVNGIANGIKGIVDAAEKAGEEGKLSVVAAGGADNADAGKLFAKKNNDGGDATDAGKAAAAVSAVSGEQILKAIVEAAGKGDGKAVVEDVKKAKNPIEAAIGSTKDDKAAGAFAENGMKKDDQIAAAIVLRGMAKDGEFALKEDDHANHEKTVKNV
ncbi:variable large family protein, partial [Borreliella bavariensis]|uniref:variable large family protein n=1 Tax=Borreliella bavariensis TaxID=664662 RepID=UPI001F1995E0